MPINLGNGGEKAALVFVLLRLHPDYPDFELTPELLEVYEIAAQSYLTERGHLLKRLTFDESAKNSFQR
ncbi:MAG: hypothetical protein LBW85_01475 [Deltaproteobacteria bacterium]|nr:hypothetical protein [Deltaproteobacteria bacterium]